MKKIRKIIVLAVVFSFVFGLSSCRSSKTGCPTNFSINVSQLLLTK